MFDQASKLVVQCNIGVGIAEISTNSKMRFLIAISSMHHFLDEWGGGCMLWHRLQPLSARRKRREERLKEPFVGVELLRLIFILQLQSGQGQVQHQSFGYLQTQRKTAYPINLIEGLRTSRAWGYIFNRVKWKTFCWTSRKVSFLGKLYNNYRFQSL